MKFVGYFASVLLIMILETFMTSGFFVSLLVIKPKKRNYLTKELILQSASDAAQIMMLCKIFSGYQYQFFLSDGSIHYIEYLKKQVFSDHMFS